MSDPQQLLQRAALGIELGSTRIKAVLVNEENQPIASGSHGWENRLEGGVWTYSLNEVWSGLQSCYRDLCQDVRRKYGVPLTRVAAIGVSAMMHGYLAFDREGVLLAPFRTWRNTMTEQAACELSEAFQFNVPQRWSVAHLYQAILNGEAHVPQIDYLTTLAGYVHWQLTGEQVLGVGDASGMFPIDSETSGYNVSMLRRFDELVADRGYAWRLVDLLPAPLNAGEEAGALTAEGARLLDPTGALEAGIPLCPPEGDAGTGMTATNSVAARTGNVSAGTSIFAMIVLRKALSRAYPEIDMVTTPAGKPVAMVHCNNCTSDLNAWVGLFGEFAGLMGRALEPDELYGALYRKALEGEADGGGLLAYNYYSGEPITGLEAGRPLFARLPEARLNLANFMRTHLYASLATLALGMKILEGENVGIERIYGHGGLFKTAGVGQQLLADAIRTPVSVMETAGEGGAWGMALLAQYRATGAEQPLEDYLNERVFAGRQGETLAPDAAGAAGFDAYLRRYAACLPIETSAVDTLS